MKILFTKSPPILNVLVHIGLILPTWDTSTHLISKQKIIGRYRGWPPDLFLNEDTGKIKVVADSPYDNIHLVWGNFIIWKHKR